MSADANAVLVTADGEVFRGRSLGVEGVAVGELVFNTAMTGYQEVITDPSYAGQIVVMTAPHIGNYGVTEDDDQAARPMPAGLVVRSLSPRESNWRATGSLTSYLERHRFVALADVDTRRLTRHVRSRGAMPVAMGVGLEVRELAAMAAEAPPMAGQDLATGVSTPTPYRVDSLGERRALVAAIDLGIKRDILRQLARRGCEVEVLPAAIPATEILAMNPDGVFISNGPGDPEPLIATTNTIRQLLGIVPVFGICLGHQVLGLALGARTFKLPFGHHGGNHPVRRLVDGKVDVTSQNHGFAVDLWSLTTDQPPPRGGLAHPGLLPSKVETPFGAARPTHQNLNDGTLEGLACADVPAFGVQYHPEAAPGPHDSIGLFDEFLALMGRQDERSRAGRAS